MLSPLVIILTKHRNTVNEVVGKSCNRTGPDRSAGNYRSSPTENYGQLRIPIPGFSADTGSHLCGNK